MKELYYSWNPPIQPTLTAVGKNDIDDYLLNFDDDNDDDNHDSPTPGGNDAGGLSNSNRMEICPLRGDPTGLLSTGMVLASNPLTLPGAEINQGDVVPQHLIPSGISNITQLTLDQFDNNYRLFAQKFYVEPDHVQEAIIASTCKQGVYHISGPHLQGGYIIMLTWSWTHMCSQFYY